MAQFNPSSAPAGNNNSINISGLNATFQVWDNNDSITDVDATLWSLMSRLAAEAAVSKLRLAKGSQVNNGSQSTSQVRVWW